MSLHTAQNQAPRTPSRRGALGRLRPFRAARPPRRWQRVSPIRPAVWDPKLDPAAGHPRPAPVTL